MENQKKILFDIKQMPWEELKQMGLTEETFLDLPKDTIDRILTGNLSPVMKMNFVDAQGKPLDIPENMKFSQDEDGIIPTKFRLVKDEKGDVHVHLYPKKNEVDLHVGETELSQADLARMKDQESVLTMVRRNGKDEKCYIQLDTATNYLQITREQDIKIPNAIGDVVIGDKQAQQIREGKPVELEVGDTKVTVGVDLNARNGFRIVEGDMDEWRQHKLEQWDRVTPGVKGYWKTSENGWEYQLHSQREENLTRQRTVEQGTGRTLSQEDKLDIGIRQSRGMRR